MQPQRYKISDRISILKTRYPAAYFLANHYIILSFSEYAKTAASESLRIAAVLLSFEHFIFFNYF